MSIGRIETNSAGTKLVDVATWKSASDAERPGLGLIKSNSCDPEVVKAPADEDQDQQLLSWVVSNEGVDRDRDIIRISGWDLKAYKKNPVVLWAHNYSQLPIGKAVEVVADKEKLQLRMVKQFASKEINPFAAMVYQLAKQKYLRTASVGFIPQKWEENTEGEPDTWGRRGLIITRQELLESSVVPVPSNPGCLAEARSVHGIDLAPYVDWAEEILDSEKGDGIWIPRKAVEEIIGVVRPARPTVVVSEARSVEVPAPPTPSTPVPSIADGAPAPVVDAKITPSNPGPVSTPEPTFTETAAEAAVLIRRLDAGIDALVAAVADAKSAVAALRRATKSESPDVEDDAETFDLIEDEDPTDNLYELSFDDEREGEPDNQDLYEVDPALLREALREVIGAR